MTHYVTIRERNEMARMYREGHPLSAITKATGREHSVVRRHIIEAGVPMRPVGHCVPLKPAEIEHMRWLYRHGHTVYAIAKATGRSQAGVRRMLKRVGDLEVSNRSVLCLRGNERRTA